MQTALVLGGTRFFGKRLVQELLDKGIKVTLANRGITEDPFGKQVERIIVDRYEEESMLSAFEDYEFDMIFDNICYSSEDARIAIKVFTDKVSRYIFTSTLSVYDEADRFVTEEDFDPYHYPVEYVTRQETSYKEGKRLAEAVFFQEAPFPVAAIRFPIVLGDDDYTRRLHFHVEHVMKQWTIGIPNLDATIGFIPANQAARFLLWAAEEELEGTFNACSHGGITLKGLISLIEDSTGKQAIIMSETADEHMSPFGITQSVWCMSNEKAKETGFLFVPLQEWLPSLIQRITKTFEKEESYLSNHE